MAAQNPTAGREHLPRLPAEDDRATGTGLAREVNEMLSGHRDETHAECEYQFPVISTKALFRPFRSPILLRVLLLEDHPEPRSLKMSRGKNGGTAKGADYKHAVALALIAIVPSTITAVGGFLAGTKQAPPAPPPAPLREPPVKNSEAEQDINKVRGVFTGATVDADRIHIHCKGGISNLKPETQGLWLAVEVNGHIFFKRGDFSFNASLTSWDVTIKEEGESKAVSLLLYVVTKDAEKEILAWLEKGEKGGKYEEVTSITGAYPLAYLNNLKVRD
jgi:hypothetical protein